MEDKCKQHGHGNAGQVERTEINSCADLLLTTSSQYSCKFKRNVSTKSFGIFVSTSSLGSEMKFTR
jgi:hypothetical protein